MRSTIIILVLLVIEFVYCAHIGFSENDTPGNVEKDKLRSELFEKFLINPKKVQITSLKELVGAKQKKRCDTCRESARCKTFGKCDLCTRYCKDVDATTMPSPIEAPFVGSVQLHLEDKTLPTNGVVPFGNPGRYYTLGAFGPGPKQNLIVRLMNVPRKKSLDKLVVLGKSKGRPGNEDPEHPFIIDTANAFQTEESNKQIHAEVHALDGSNLPPEVDLELTSKIDQELDIAVAEKQRNFGKSFLTNQEIDKIIERVLAMVSSPHQANLAEDVVQIGSRMGEINHLTTKRSISDWPLAKPHEDPIVGTRFPEDLPQHIETGRQNLILPSIKKNNRRSQRQHQNQFLNTIVGKSNAEINSKRDSYIAEDEFAENVGKMDSTEDGDDSSEAGQDLQEFEPAPPTNLDEINQSRTEPVHQETESSNANQNRSQITSPKVLSVPISNHQKLESANQYLEEDSQNNPVELAHSKQFTRTGDEDADDVIVTLTQAPDLYDTNSSNFHASNPILGNTWVSDELDKARQWWHHTVGMQTPHDVGASLSASPNRTDERFQVAENKSSFLNASHFTTILKNLEQKVENIADLVKKTCGKPQPEDEAVGAAQPSFMKQRQEQNPAPKSGDVEQSPQRALARNPIQVIEVPEDGYDDKQNITTNPSPQQPPDLLDTAFDDLNKGSNFLINKAVDIADRLQDFSAKRVQNKPILQATENENVGAANSDRKVLSKDGVLVGCSKEDSEEYVGEKLNGEIQMRSGFEPEATSPSGKTNLEENVACSNEDSEEYLGEALQQPENKKDISKPLQNSRSTADGETLSEQPQPQPDPEETKKRVSTRLQNTFGTANGEEAPNSPNREASKSPDEKALKSPAPKSPNREASKGTDGETLKSRDGEAPKSPTREASKGPGGKTLKSPDGEAPKNPDEENVACSNESDEYVGEQEEQKEDADKRPKKKNYLNVLSPISPGKHSKSVNPDNDITDSQIVNEAVARSKENEDSLGQQQDPANEEAVGCSEEEEEYAVPVYPPYGSSPYRESNSKPKSSGLPKHKLPHIPALDKLLHRSALPKESILPPLRKHSKASLPKLDRIFNHNRDGTLPAAAQQTNDPEVFGVDPHEEFSNIPANIHRGISEPDNSEVPSLNHPLSSFSSSPSNIQRGIVKPEFAPNIDQPRRSNILLPNIPEPEEPNYEADPPLADILSPSTPARQRGNRVLVPPALHQRFGEQGRVGPDGFHLHRPMTLKDWPQLASKEDVLGARQKDDIETETPLAANSQNPFSIFGKVVPQLNNTEISFHHVPSNKIYFLGTGMQLPLNMKKGEDGTYQLSVDIEKLCDNCKESKCNNRSNNDEVSMKDNQADETRTADEVVGASWFNSSGTQKANSTAERNLNLESDFNQLDQSADKRKSPHKIEIVAMDMPRSRLANRRAAKHSPASTELLGPERTKSKRKLKYRSLFDADPNDERKHSKRSPAFDIILPSLGNTEETNGRKNEASPSNSVDYDKSLKKIDSDMKRYFDRRQKLDDFYKEQVRRSLEQPDDERDIVKRRVKLVNNVLTWMKNLAAEDPH